MTERDGFRCKMLGWIYGNKKVQTYRLEPVFDKRMMS
jgi:hypothetical protein